MRILCTPPRHQQGSDWCKELRIEAGGGRYWLVLALTHSAYESAIRLHTSDPAYPPLFASRRCQYPLEALNALFETLLLIEDVDDLLPLAEALLA